MLEPGQLEALQALSRQVVALLEARSTLRQLAAETRERERAQAEAAVAVERFRMVFESAPIAMAIADAAGVLADVNPSYAELLGYDREQLVGRPVRELIADDDVKLAELRGIGRTDVRQVAHRHADGHLLPTLVFTSVIRDASGAVVAYLGQVESVAERLAAQDLLLEAQSAVDAIITIDDRGRVLAWNVGAERMFGYARAEMLARSLTEVVPERFRALHQGGLDRLRDGGVPRLVGQTVEVVALRRDGGEFAAELSLSAWERAGVTNYTGVVRDVSERVAAEAQRLLAQTRAALLGSAAGAINQAVTLDRAIAAVLAQVCEATGWQAGHAWLVEQGRLRPTGIWQSHAGAPDERFRTLTERNVLASGEDLPGRVLATARSALDHAATTREPSPRRRAAKASGITTRLGVPILAGDEVVGVLEFHPGDAGQAPDQDWITVLEQVGAQLGRAVERQRAEQELTRRATHDPLTGLANRTLLLDHLQEASLRGRRDGTFAAVLFCDLDRFKVVNDSLGHAAGDELLQLVAARLASVLRPSDLLAHPGGDEFVVVCSDLADETVAQQVAARLLAALDAPFPLMGHDVVVDASIGVATTGREAGAEELLRYADLAMYRAKDQGGGRAEVFDDRFREQVQQRLSTESGLRRALEGDELRVHYQPIVELATGRVSSVEALVRWDRPGHGLVAPDRFIPLAEDTGLIVSLGAQVLRTACRQAARWSRERPELAAVGLAVNLSARQLRHPGLLGTVQAALDDSGLTPGRLTLELTESVLA